MMRKKTKEQAFIDIVSAIDKFTDRGSSYMQSINYLGYENSPFKKELRMAAFEDTIFTGHSMSSMQNEYVWDHLSGFTRSSRSPVCVYACITCIRSMLESAAISCWLTDPTIGVNLREMRVLALRYSSLQEQLSLERYSLNRPDKISDCQSRMDKISALTRESGGEEILNKHKKRIGVGTRILSATDLIQSMLGIGGIYKIFSGYSHGDSVMLMDVFDIGEMEIDRSGNEYHPGVKTVPLDILILAGLEGFLASARMLWNFAVYVGAPLLPLEEILEDVADESLILKDRRFWRSYIDPSDE